jgi:hypothetical protein
MSDWAGDGDGSDALDELARWLRDAVARTGLTHEALAGRLYRDRTAISQAMLGVMLPPLPVTEAIAEGCDADTMTARRLWAAARGAAAVRARRAGEGWPPVDLANHSELCQALRSIVAHRRLSLRQLVDLDDTAVLTRSMTSYVLRGQRCVTYQVMIAILDVCQVSHEGQPGTPNGGGSPPRRSRPAGGHDSKACAPARAAGSTGRGDPGEQQH